MDELLQGLHTLTPTEEATFQRHKGQDGQQVISTTVRRHTSSQEAPGTWVGGPAESPKSLKLQLSSWSSLELAGCSLYSLPPTGHMG